MQQRYSWGHYPNFAQQVTRLHWRDEVAPALLALHAERIATLPYGNGRSYGDSCLGASDRLLQMRGINRFISADWERGIICAEAGVTLAEILQVSIPHGWFLPVTPGTKFVTLGGAVANDVHGKNHHVRGTFGANLTRFALQRSDRGLLECSAQENPDLFAATIGGLGLTGVIVWVELQLMPIQSSAIDAINFRFRNLDEFFDLSQIYDNLHEYSVAWVDCLASGSALGRGHFTVGGHSAEGDLEVVDRRKLMVPVTPPFSLVNAFSLRAFNEAYYHRQRRRERHFRCGYDSFFYPLDTISHWNRLYGSHGFQQYQCVIPQEHARAVMPELLRSIAACKAGSFLAVLKRCGDMLSPGLLSFPLAGVSLALDFPQREDVNKKLFSRLDTIVHECGGRLYPAKDAHMRGADFRGAYPAWEKLEALRDPLMMSRFWQRVTRAD
ncbi:MAG TPA: FAD-binding oxidoreductase [Spongiibacteraceae bacterium]|nr:FAD-binding oxidoreductase [Spongiibacteraceae bacterium]